MKKIILLTLFFLPVTIFAAADGVYKGLAPSGKMVLIPSPNKQLLPNQFPIYTNGKFVMNHPAPGFNKVELPINNQYQKNPGCYIMCYSRQPGLYQVDKDIYAQGMVRVAGTYQNRICRPTDAGNADISAMQSYKDLCNQRIKNCHGDCWAGGDTGGWYGMQLE